MVLTDSTIKRLAIEESMIEPFASPNLQPASYDLTIAEIKSEDERSVWTVNPGETVLIGTVERVILPPDVCGFIKDKSSYLRQLCNVGQGFVDPGFRGNLTISFTNHSKRAIAFSPGMSFCQIVFIGTDTEVLEAYNGHYQDSDGIAQTAVLGIGR